MEYQVKYFMHVEIIKIAYGGLFSNFLHFIIDFITTRGTFC